jgi:flagellar biosynthetic protein FliO
VFAWTTEMFFSRNLNRRISRVWTCLPGINRQIIRVVGIVTVLICTLMIPEPASAEILSDADILGMSLDEAPNPGQEDQAEDQESPGVADMVARMALALGIVLALMSAVLWAARRWSPHGVRGKGGQAIEVLANHTIGQRRSLMMVRVKGKSMLLGVTPQQIHFLSDLEDESFDSWQDAARQSGLPFVGNPVLEGIKRSTDGTPGMEGRTR